MKGRRYRSHPEALRGSLAWPLRLCHKPREGLVMLAVSFFICGLLPNALADAPLPWTTTLLLFASLYLAVWLVGTLAVYAATALAGGVAGHRERDSGL